MIVITSIRRIKEIIWKNQDVVMRGEKIISPIYIPDLSDPDAPAYYERGVVKIFIAPDRNSSRRNLKKCFKELQDDFFHYCRNEMREDGGPLYAKLYFDQVILSRRIFMEEDKKQGKDVLREFEEVGEVILIFYRSKNAATEAYKYSMAF